MFNSFMDSEPKKPHMISDKNRPKSDKIIQELSQYMDTAHMISIIDLHNSRGNYVADIDGNIMLDLMTQTSSISCGYNNPLFEKFSTEHAEELKLNYINRPSFYGIHPTFQAAPFLRNILMKLAPQGLNHVVICRDALENSFRMARRRHKRERVYELTVDDITTYTATLGEYHHEDRNQPLVAGFRYRPESKGLLPEGNELRNSVPFPELQYPLPVNTVENRKREEEALQKVEDLLNREKMISAFVVQPVLIDRHASVEFYQSLRELISQHDILFIVDETYTCGGLAGSYYAHQQWHLNKPPDIVVFNNQLHGSGFYHREGLKVPHPYRFAFTDPISVWQIHVMLELSEEFGLFDSVRHAGSILRDGLFQLEQQYPDMLNSSRGFGAFCAIDCENRSIRDRMIDSLHAKGFLVGGSGLHSIIVRPQLIFGEKHAKILLEAFEETVSDLAIGTPSD